MSLLRASATPAGIEQRRIDLAGRDIAFTLRRSQRRSLSMTIDRRGLTVSIPTRVSLRETEAFMRERAGWIIEKLDEWAQRPVAASTAIHDGMSVPVLGEPCRVIWRAGSNRTRWVEGMNSRELHLQLRRSEDAPKLLLHGLQTFALEYFCGRVDEYGFLLQRIAPDVALPAVRLSSARTRWGSCSRLSGIRLNWRLIHLPQAQIDYVVAHEVAHLLEMNHSPRFWRVVEQLKPDFEVAKAELRHANRIIPVF
jgi:predicted metal-dependent hydrolase